MYHNPQVTFLTLVLGLGLTACGGGSTGAATNVGNSAMANGSRSSTTTGTYVELHGPIESIVAPALVVAGKAVTTNGDTRIVRHDVVVAFDTLTVGTKVEVKGDTQADGSILATRIDVEDSGTSGTGSHDGEDDADEHARSTDTIVFVAALQSVDGTTLKVGDLPVTVSDTTRLVKADHGITVADLQVGDTLVVRGRLGAGPSVAATRIRVVVAGSHDGVPDDDHDDH